MDRRQFQGTIAAMLASLLLPPQKSGASGDILLTPQLDTSTLEPQTDALKALLPGGEDVPLPPSIEDLFAHLDEELEFPGETTSVPRANLLVVVPRFRDAGRYGRCLAELSAQSQGAA